MRIVIAQFSIWKIVQYHSLLPLNPDHYLASKIVISGLGGREDELMACGSIGSKIFPKPPPETFILSLPKDRFDKNLGWKHHYCLTLQTGYGTLEEMKVTFSDHALKQLQERKISRVAVMKVVTKPERVIQQTPARYRAIGTITKQRKRFLLVVVYDEKNTSREVVTAFLTTKFRKYL